MAAIFISYQRGERAAIERLASALRRWGLDVWFDASLSAGEAFSDEIDREVRAAQAIIVCWSQSAVESKWVKAEAHVGFAKGNLISVRVGGPDELEPPVPFNSLHTEDLRSWIEAPGTHDSGWLSTLRSLARHLTRADIADWASLGPNPTAAQMRGWLEAHGSSPFASEAVQLLERKTRAGANHAAQAAMPDELDEETARRRAKSAAEEARAEAQYQLELAEYREGRVVRSGILAATVLSTLVIGVASGPALTSVMDALAAPPAVRLVAAIVGFVALTMVSMRFIYTAATRLVPRWGRLLLAAASNRPPRRP